MSKEKTKGQLVQQMLMVKLNISYDTGYRSCDEMREIVVDKSNADYNRMRAGFNLFDKYATSAFTTAISQARRHYLEETLPWDKKNWRVIPVSKWQTFKNELDSYISNVKEKFEEVFHDNYDELKSSFEEASGDLDINFPDEEGLDAQFNIGYDIGQIASCDDIRIQGIDQMERIKIREDMQKQYDEKINGGLTELAERVVRAAEDVAVRARDPEQKGKKYSKSLSNLNELADTVESLNITGNEAISEACKIIREDIGKY